jgi:hypothetical protein
VDAEHIRGFREASCASPKHAGDEAFFELARGVLELDASVDHLFDELLEAVTNLRAPSRSRGPRALIIPEGPVR